MRGIIDGVPVTFATPAEAETCDICVCMPWSTPLVLPDNHRASCGLMWLGAATSPGCAKGPDEALPRVRDAVGAVVVSRFTWNIPRTAATGIFTAPFVVR